MMENKARKDNFLKQTELSLKKAINNMLKGGKTPKLISKPENVFKQNPLKKIIILRHDRIGDVLVTIPTLSILSKYLPEVNIDIVLSERNEGVSPSLEPYVNNVLIYKKDIKSVVSLRSNLRQEKYDLLIDPFDNISTTSALLISMAKAKQNLGIDKDNRNLYDFVVPLLDKNKYHIVDRIAQLLIPFGIDPEKEKKHMDYVFNLSDLIKAKNLIGEKDNVHRIGVILNGSSDAKFWGITNNVKFINRIDEQYNNIEFVVFATRDMEDKLELIKEKTNAKIAPFVDSVHEYAMLLSTCDLILTPDTSAVHFAAAFNIPAIALYKVVPGHSSGKPWTPYGSPFKAIQTSKDSLKDIQIDEVVNAFRELHSEISKRKN
jgi:ADP-heptose:LPS heptosyltransferase